MSLLTDRQISSLCKRFANSSSANIKLSKTRLSSIIQSSGFLIKFLQSLMRVDLLLMKNILTPLTKRVLIPLGLTVATPVTDAGIHKRS